MDRDVTATGKTLGLEFNYDRVLVTPNTFAGHRLLWWARDKGSQDILADSLFRAYFTKGLDIGKNEVLTAVAADAGLSEEDAKHFLKSDQGRDEVLQEEQEGLRHGLNGVPFFVINLTSSLLCQISLVSDCLPPFFRATPAPRQAVGRTTEVNRAEPTEN